MMRGLNVNRKSSGISGEDSGGERWFAVSECHGENACAASGLRLGGGVRSQAGAVPRLAGQVPGRLAIHAGRGNPAEGEWAWAELARLGVKVPDDVPRSAIVGTVELVDCVRKGSGELWPDERLAHPLASGPVCWLLEDAQALDELVSMPGRQGIWEAAF